MAVKLDIKTATARELGVDILCMKNRDREPHELFRVSLAFYTVQAQLMILPSQGLVESEDVPEGLADLSSESRRKLVAVARDALEIFDLNDDILLSIHVGSWQTLKYIHARLCLQPAYREVYLKMFDEMKELQPLKTIWMNPKIFDTPYWRIRDKHTLSNEEFGNKLHDLVRRGINYDHKRRDTVALETIVHQDPYVDISGPAIGYRYHNQKPLIGIPWPNDPGDPINRVLWYIEELEKLYEHIRVRDPECDGCHVCVRMGTKGVEGFGPGDPILGYLHISPLTFYKILPRNQRQEWIDNYNCWDGVVYT